MMKVYIQVTYYYATATIEMCNYYVQLFWQRKVEIGPEKLLCAIINSLTFELRCGSLPLNLLELISMVVEFIIMEDKSPSIWFRKRSIKSMPKAKFQNQCGIVSDIPVFEMSKKERDVCVFSHEGKFGPILQELTPSCSN